MSDPDSNRPKCTIAVDAMGGDFAPQNAVKGAVEALQKNKDFNLLLVGPANTIQKTLQDNNLNFNPSNIVNASEVVSMDDPAAAILKSKPDSSLVVGCRLVKEKRADAFVSAGNTGAMMSASTLVMGRIPGVGRPTIGAEMPSTKGICYLYDVGAGKDSKPQHLVEYAVMGSIYARVMGGVKNPSVGLLAMGEEQSKGNEVGLEAFELLKKTNLNFIGNVEGRDILSGAADVIICDGFVGNIILKFGESVPKLLKHLLASTAEKSFIDKLKVGISRGVLRKSLKVMDYQEHGGVPLLGVNGISIIGHGSSTPKAITNMVLKAYEMHKKELVGKIQSAINEYSNSLKLKDNDV